MLQAATEAAQAISAAQPPPSPEQPALPAKDGDRNAGGEPGRRDGLVQQPLARLALSPLQTTQRDEHRLRDTQPHEQEDEIQSDDEEPADPARARHRRLRWALADEVVLSHLRGVSDLHRGAEGEVVQRLIAAGGTHLPAGGGPGPP